MARWRKMTLNLERPTAYFLHNDKYPWTGSWNVQGHPVTIRRGVKDQKKYWKIIANEYAQDNLSYWQIEEWLKAHVRPQSDTLSSTRRMALDALEMAILSNSPPWAKI